MRVSTDQLMDQLRRRPMSLFLFVLLVLLCANASCLLDPPYWDAIFGPFNQALWLRANRFDFIRLWSVEPSYLGGGSNINPYCPLPVLYALFYVVASREVVFLLAHLLVLSLAALTFTLYFRILSDLVSPWSALLWCVAASCEPVWSGQCASMYREVPVAAVSALAVFSLHRERLGWAWFWAVLACLVKETALLLLLAMLVWLVVRALCTNPRGPRGACRDRPWLFGLAGLAMVVVLGGGARVFGSWSGVLTGLHRRLALFPWHCRFFFPSLAVELGAITGLTLAAVCGRRGRERLRTERGAAMLGLLLLLVTAGFWTAYGVFPEPLPRYAVFAVFPMAGLLALGMRGRAGVLAAAVMIVCGAANQHGGLLPTIPVRRQRSGDCLERSREYLADLEANRRICAALERQFSTTPIVCKWPFAQMLTMPDLGYVDRALPHVYAAGVRPLYCPVEPYQPEVEIPGGPLFVYAPNAFAHWAPFRPSLAPRSGDVLLFRDESLPGAVLVYRRQAGAGHGVPTGRHDD